MRYPQRAPEAPQSASGLLQLTTSPHSHSNWSTPRIMWTVVACLLPSLLAAVYFFGPGVLLPIIAAVFGALVTEGLSNKVLKKGCTNGDGSAALTGLLLGLILPPGFPIFGAFLGGVVAIGIGKAVFGGLGHNIFNPALVGRAFLQAAFPAGMTAWAASLSKVSSAVDGITSATPLGWMKFTPGLPKEEIHGILGNMFFGNTGGCIGETSALAILLGGLVLVFLGLANWRIVLSMILSGLAFGALFHATGASQITALHHLLAGGFLFGAFFMATDMVTSPITMKGMYIYGAGIGLMTVLIRVFGGLPEGVMFSILLMNATVPLINRWTVPKVFGGAR